MTLEGYLNRYVGYELDLYSPLSLSVCVERLKDDFKTPHFRIPRETVSDKALGGHIVGRDITLTFNKKRLSELSQASESLYRRRALSATLSPRDGGTRIRGHYGYGIGAMFVDIIVLVVGVIVGAALVLAGLGAGFQGQLLALVAMPIGAIMAIGAILNTSQPGAAEMVRERDYVTGYLMRLLGAEPRGR